MSAADSLDEIPDIDGDHPPRLTRALVGHAAQQQTFLSAMNGKRMPHAWLLTGPKGVGKASFAYLAARAALSSGVTQALSPAQETAESHLIEEASHPDLFILQRRYNEKTGKFRGDIPVDDARALKQSFGLSAGRGGWRVAVIDSIDDMNKNGVNALLKLIEEPPEKCLFLIVCHQPGRVLDTIRSRCRTLAFNALSEPELQQIVHHRLNSVDPNEAAAASFLADGSAGYALSLAALGGFELYREMVGVLETAPRTNIEKLHDLASRFGARAEPAQFDLFCYLFSGWLHRLARCAATGEVFQPVFEGEAELVNRLIAGQLDLAGLVSLWEKVGKDAHLVQSLNLDKKQAVIEWVSGFAKLAVQGTN